MKVKYQQSEKAAVLWQRYAWVGAGLGLYFGLFFRPAREPSLLVVLGFSLLAAVVTGIIRLVRRDGSSLKTLLWQTAVLWGQYALFLAMLEGRHFAYAWGGRPATAVFATIVGALIGLWYGYTSMPQK